MFPSRMKLFFAFTVFLLSISYSSTAQEYADVSWFENLFLSTEKIEVDKALNRLEDTRKEAVEMQDRSAEIKALIELGAFYHIYVHDYEKSLEWYIQALTLEDTYSRNEEKVFTLLGMARVFEEVGDYYKSDDFLNQAMEINKISKHQQVLMLILNERGRLNALQGNIEEAYEDYEKMLQFARQLQLPDREADALFHLGQLQTKKKEYNQALQTHKEALVIRRASKDKIKESLSLNDIGELYELMNNPARALANHEAALEIRQGINDQRGMAESYNNLGTVYFEKKDFKKAISLLNQGLQASLEAQEKEQIRVSYDYLSLCYKELRDFKKALNYKESLLAIEKFIENERNERQLLETQNRYSLNKKETEIQALESEREQRDQVIEAQHTLRNILIAFISLGILIVILVTYLYLMKQKANRELKKINDTKDKLFSIIGHDLKGPLHSLTSFVSLLNNHIDHLSKEEIKKLSLDLDKSLKNLFALLENLLEWARSQTGNIDFKAEVFDLHSVMRENEELLRGQTQNKGLTFLNKTTEGIWVNAHRNSINTVVRNLISNAIKFTPSGGVITISAKPQGKHWLVSIADTGVGMSEIVQQKLFQIGSKHSTAGTAQEKGTGLGLILCKDFVEKNGGTLIVESTEGIGSNFKFTIPARLQ